MAKQLKYGDDARKALLKGIETVNKAVSTTLGPKGRNVALDKKWGAPSIIHDGVTVAKDIELPDPFENMGAQIVKEASSKTNDAAGDGTTTSTLLAYVMSAQGLRNVTAGANPMIVKKGMEKAVEAVVASLKKMAKPVKGEEEITQVAKISAGDDAIGAKIAEALEKVGRDGVVTVEEGKGFEIEIDYKEGMEFDKGYASAYFATNPEKMEAEIENPYILITDKKISSIEELLPFLEKFVKVSKNLVIIADEIEGQALTTLVVNKLRGTINILAIKAPGFGDRRKDSLEDIAVLTGGTVIAEDTGKKFESVEVTDLGQAEKVWADKDNSRIIGGKGLPSALKARIQNLKAQISEVTSDFDREKLEERLAKLAGGVAVINVGAATEVELNEKKERVKDAVGATKAAIEEGIVAGGAVALLQARKVLKDKKFVVHGYDEQVGVNIVYDALGEPLRYLLINAEGEDSAAQILSQIWKKHDEESTDFGYDVITRKYGSMLKMGILDPLKVTRSAITNAASVAQMVLTTECLVTDLPEEKNPSAGSGQAGMGMPGGMDY